MLEHYLSKRFYFLTDSRPVYKTVQKESTFFLGLSFLRVWPDFPASDFKFILAFRNPPTADKIGFELGLFWVCFGFVFLGLKVVSFS